MAEIKDAINNLAGSFQSDDDILLSAEHARTIYNLLTANPHVLALDIADAALEVTHTARACFWMTPEWDGFADAHRRLVRELRALVVEGWLEVES